MSRAVVLARHPEGAVTEQDFAVVDVVLTTVKRYLKERLIS